MGKEQTGVTFRRTAPQRDPPAFPSACRSVCHTMLKVLTDLPF